MKMAKTAKSVKKAVSVSSQTATRKVRPQTKTPARKTTSRKTTAARTAKKAPMTRVGVLVELLPASLGENRYISRTLRIFEQDELRRARSRAQRARQLGQVVSDIQSDISERITAVEESTVQTFEDLTERVKAVGVVQHATQLPAQVTHRVADAMDQLLDRVGLVRKARFDQAIAALPLARRRRAAA
ncbi:MAG: hypothetical protein ABI333_01695 [bacterium]